jgi:hypothetical protein
VSGSDKFDTTRPSIKYHAGGNARVGAMGDNASASNFAQGDKSSVLTPADAATAARALKSLMSHLQERAETPEQEEDVARVQKAQAAAEAGDHERVTTWLGRLSGAGRWGLQAATEIGSKVAEDLITGAIKGG